MSDRVLVADIGGTNARFALAELSSAAIVVTDAQNFRAEDFDSISAAAGAYFESVRVRPTRACFAVAGPITDEVVEFTNSPWRFDIKKTKADLDFERLLAVNDFAALASSVRALGADDLLSVKPGRAEREAPILVIGPGTGFGQALIVPAGGRDVIVPTEGGHVGFSPQTEEEIEVLRFIAREHQRVSIERILSGRGLVNLHRALCAAAGTPRITLEADQITRAAATGEYPIAAQAVSMFCAILGAVAGDAALATGARGGVVLGGGILPKIRDVLLASAFKERFLNKGRMRDYVESIPVDLIIRDGAALVGAAVMLKEAHGAY